MAKYSVDEFEKELALLNSGVLKDSCLRLEYEQKVRRLSSLVAELEQSGMDEEAMAKCLHKLRRQLGKEYKQAAPPLFREYIYYATEQKYGDPLGPDFKYLREKKSCREIIESASRPIADLDDRLTVEGFINWFSSKER